MLHSAPLTVDSRPNKKTFISREFAYHGSTMTGMSLGGMTAMHSQGDMMPGFEHVLPPYWYSMEVICLMMILVFMQRIKLRKR